MKWLVPLSDVTIDEQEVQAVAEVLSGKAPATGQLPMTLTLNPN